MKKISDKPILVTRSFLPPIEEFIPYLEEIWKSRWLTNSGKYHQALEDALRAYLGVEYISLFSNGTLALIIALQALRITGEVITTPFSFVATTHSLWWNNIKPVFVDIEPVYLNLNPKKVEAAITPKTAAILPVHVYGNPCDVEAFRKIGETYGVKIIYDACHAFGVTINGKSILKNGDLSVMSFHATKVFNTFEGGAIVCNDKAMKKRIDYLKNFGFAGETTIVGPGINAKMNEFQSALGLLQLKYIDGVIKKRNNIAEKYREKLEGIKGISFMDDISGVRHCYSYFPILINKAVYGYSRDEIYEELKKHNIYCRRYFYPLISQFSLYSGLPSSDVDNLPVAEKIARQVLCLPIYPDLYIEEVARISHLIKR